MRRLLVGVLATAAVALPVGASEYQDAWGPAVGTAMPAVSAPDQSGERRDLADLAGKRGTLLFVVRSADW